MGRVSGIPRSSAILNIIRLKDVDGRFRDGKREDRYCDRVSGQRCHW
jgi:hypothetical protein